MLRINIFAIRKNDMNTAIGKIDITKILFLDIETVPQYASVSDMGEEAFRLWKKKAARYYDEGSTDEDVYSRAGIYAEFGKIVCISVAYLHSKNGILEARVRSFAGDDEECILRDFLALLTSYYNTRQIYFCAHNGFEFDFPFIARRSLIHGLQLPDTLDTRGKKPWEVQHLDTLDLWRFADYKNYTSLALLAHVFGIPTPKDDMDGSQVCDVYWKQHDVSRIVTYCQKDVITVMQLFRKYRCEEIIPEERITIVTDTE